MRKVSIFIFFTVVLFISGCSDETLTGTIDDGNKVYYEGGPHKDSKGSYYLTVKIGDQIWFKENLNVGTMIKSSKGGQLQTDNGIIEKYCYDNDERNGSIYGALYEWNEAMQYDTTEGAQGICPPGWHIPTYSELQTLASYVNNEAAKLVDKSQTTNGYTATNETGFSALFSGKRDYDNNGKIEHLGDRTAFWSSYADSMMSHSAASMYIYHNKINVNFRKHGKFYGCSVRCIKD